MGRSAMLKHVRPDQLRLDLCATVSGVETWCRERRVGDPEVPRTVAEMVTQSPAEGARLADVGEVLVLVVPVPQGVDTGATRRVVWVRERADASPVEAEPPPAARVVVRL